MNKEDLESDERNPYKSNIEPVIKVIGRHPINKQSVCLWVHNWHPHIEVKYTATHNFENVEAAHRMIQNDLDLFKSALNAKLKSDSIITRVILKYGYDFYFYNQNPETFLIIEFTLPWLRQKIREIIENESFPGIVAQPYDAHIQLDMQFSADMNISYEEPIHLSKWILDSRPKKRLNFYNGQPEPGTRKTSCDVEIHCDVTEIMNQYSHNHLPPQIKGFGGLERFQSKGRREKATKMPSQNSDVTTVSNESNMSSQWKHSWLVKKGQSILEDQVSNLSLSVSFTQSTEETANDPDEQSQSSQDECSDEISSDEEKLDQALMSILENFSDDEKSPS